MCIVSYVSSIIYVYVCELCIVYCVMCIVHISSILYIVCVYIIQYLSIAYCVSSILVCIAGKSVGPLMKWSQWENIDWAGKPLTQGSSTKIFFCFGRYRDIKSRESTNQRKRINFLSQLLTVTSQVQT